METLLNNILLYCSPILWAIFVTITFIGKAILKKHGFEVTFMNVSISDYRNLKKLISENTKLIIIYHSLIISTICVSITIVLFIISMILY